MSSHLSISFVAAVNDDSTLQRNLSRSHAIASGDYEFEICKGFPSASLAYNQGINQTSGEIIVFAHQDVYLPKDWMHTLCLALGKLSQQDPNWAVVGAFGLSVEGRTVGHAWSSGIGRLLGTHFEGNIRAGCLDELLIIIRRASGVHFDAELPGFHLYGTDIVLEASRMGMHSYVLNIPVIHNSRPVAQLRADYREAYDYMRRKWIANLPIDTLIAPITRSSYPLLKVRTRMWITRRKRMRHSHSHLANPADIARALCLECDQ